MSCPETETRLAAYMDDELSPAERQRFEEHLAHCPACQQELKRMDELHKELAAMTLRAPTDAELEQYWQGVYNRLERRVGWVLLSAGAIILLAYAAFALIDRFIRNPEVELAARIGVAAVVLGLVVLFVSLLRERLTLRKSDRYSRDVKR